MSQWEKILYQISEEMARTFALKWNAEKNSIKLVSKGINLVYSFQVQSKLKYLKITCESIRKKIELEAALAFQIFLFENFVNVSIPIKSKNENYIESIAYNNEVFHASVYQEVQGSPLNVNSHISQNVLRIWGENLAQLHVASEKYPHNKKFIYLDVFNLLEESRQYVKEEPEPVQKIFYQLENWLNSISKQNENYGLTHGDHRDANVICDNFKVAFIDFDEPVYHFYLADVVRPFIFLFGNNTNNIPESLIYFIEGYKSVKNIDYDYFWLYNFAKLKALEMYLWTKNNWNGSEVPGGEKREIWLDSLRKVLSIV